MGKRISAVEKASWHPDVDVYFQTNAWADTNFCAQLVKKPLKLVVESRFVIFLDNLEGQIADEFKQEVAKLVASVGMGYQEQHIYGNLSMQDMLNC